MDFLQKDFNHLNGDLNLNIQRSLWVNTKKFNFPCYYCELKSLRSIHTTYVHWAWGSSLACIQFK